MDIVVDMVRAGAAGGGVRAELAGDAVRVWIEPGVRDLEGDLEALGRRLFVARRRAVLAAAGLHREPPPVGWREQAYVDGRNAIVACGQSIDGRVSIRVEGMRRWRVRVEDGGDARGVEEAAEALLRDQWRQIRALKRRLWD